MKENVNKNGEKAEVFLNSKGSTLYFFRCTPQGHAYNIVKKSW
jgi:hypothetical protein